MREPGPFAPAAEEDALNATINTTPLVDVMLVILIVFLITVPVALHSVPVALPQARSEAANPTPDTVVIAVTAGGQLYWNDQPLAGADALQQRLQALAARHPQPPVELRGDRDAAYAHIGRVVSACQRAGIHTLGFATDPAGQ